VWLADQFDIGDTEKQPLDDMTRKNILTSVLLPKQPFTYPSSDLGKQKRAFQDKWVTHPQNGFPFLAYSKKDDGVYCKICHLFYYEEVGKGQHENPG